MSTADGVSDESEPLRQVQVWFGRNHMRAYIAPPDLAVEYAQTIAKAFSGLRVTITPAAPGDQVETLPSKQLWALIVP